MSSRDHPDWWRPMGGQNSQDSILERRSLIWNDDGILDGAVPGAFYTGDDFKAKFFTRGCRGKIEQIQVYCTGNAAAQIHIQYSPHPCIGHFREGVLTPAAGWAWQALNIEEMWNYDSLFIWVQRCDFGVSYAYDAVQPYDGHSSDVDGDQWSDQAIRLFIRVIYTGETPGDVPVSGIINVVRIPNSALGAPTPLPVAMPNNAWTAIVEYRAPGELLQLEVMFDTVVVPAAGVEYMLRIEADGNAGVDVGNRQLTQSVIAAFGRCSMGEFFQDGTNTYLWVRLPIEYRRRLLISGFQTSGAGCNATATIVSNEPA